MKLFVNLFLVCLAVVSGGGHAQTSEPARTGPPALSAASTEPRIIRGNDQVLAPANNKGQVTGSAAAFKFEEAPLSEVVGLILRDIVKVDYVIHPPINGTVTLATQGEVPPDQAIFLLEAALQANGLVMARDARGTYHIGRPDVLKGIVPAIRQAGSAPLPPGYGAIVVPLKYMGAGEMAAILRPMSSPEAIVRVDTVRNLLVLVGTRTQAEGWLDMVATFDVDLLKGMSVGVFPLKYVTTSEVETALRLVSGGAAVPAATGAPAAGGAAAAAAARAAEAAAVTSAPFYGALRILPIERINSVIVVTSRAAYLDEARRWIEKLDQPGGNSSEAQLFIYAVQNGNAAHLANVLNGLFGGTDAATQPARSGVAPGLQQSTATTTGFGTAGVGAARTTGGNAGGASTVQGTGLTTLTLKTGLRVVADEINNAVLIYGTKSEFEKIEITLKRLDVPPTQVLIEASIIEVTLTDELQYGLQWTFTDKARGSAGLTGTGLLSTAANVAGGIALGATPAGFSYTLRNSLGDVRAVLNALADKSLVKVISSPSLMVLDNHTANVSVGNQQPVRVGETVTSGGNVTTNIQYKDTGVSLTVTPSVNAGNMVTMQINQAVTDVGKQDPATGQVAFLQRQFSSKVAVRSGETLVLGGLIRDNTTTGKTGLPLLQDIPIFGSLFGTNSKNINRTELLVVITPRVVRSEQDVRQVSQELKDRMKTLYPPLPPPKPDGVQSIQQPSSN
jgi:general secretion pathway protein D